jgi:CRISPR-associated protein Cmr2
MTDLWKRKLAAYLHDPPSKCLDIRTHGDRSDAAFRQAGFVDAEVGEYFVHADHTGAAADRLPFPKSQAAGLSCAFDGVRNAFRHPLSGEKLPFHAEFKSSEQVEELEHAVQPVLSEESLAALADDDKRWRARFLAHWRLWPKHATEKDYRMAILPADTRIPDHSIWTHMQLVSALGGCAEGEKLKPAFLKFQLGPVQDFIAAARSIRDLWSGSYLLSWLMVAGMNALSAKVGPDAVIFPTLRGQPLFDLHWREVLWDKVKIGGKTVWEDSMDRDEQEFLTPNLPNVFLAVVPAGQAADLARDVVAAIQTEWERIADAVWQHCRQAGLTADESEFAEAQRKERFDDQVNRFLSLSWQVTAWPDNLEATLQLAEGFAEGMPIVEARNRVQAVVDMAEKHMPMDHRDGRYYIGGPNGSTDRLNNIGLGWSVILAQNSWKLDAVRQTRAFDAANIGGWQVGTFSNKDALTGREEAVAGGDKWFAACKKLGEFWPKRFKKAHWLGASTLIKRLWDIAYLKPAWGLKVQKSPNTRGIAAHDPFARDETLNDEDTGDDVEDIPPSENYFAILAFDGDEIGQWVSGKKTPPFSSQLADYTDHDGKVRQGALEYFERDSDPDGHGNLKDRFAPFLASQRPLAPSYHLQFSEALGNFAILCARPIVEAFDGRLIYAGGDDVVALLPADTALRCGEALRTAFQGKEVLGPDGRTLFASPAPGFLTSELWKDENGQGRPIPFLVPGPKADCSVGIAIAHFKAPLQDVVRAAQSAEKRAKRNPDQGGLGRRAVAVTLMKRSGEIIEWGAKWDGGLELYRALAAALEGEELSSKFAHRLAELLEAYVTDTTPLVHQEKTLLPLDGFPVDDIIRREFAHCLLRQRGRAYPIDSNEATAFAQRMTHGLEACFKSLDGAGIVGSENRLRSFIGLCQTVSFAHRTAADSQPNPEPKGNP